MVSKFVSDYNFMLNHCQLKLSIFQRYYSYEEKDLDLNVLSIDIIYDKTLWSCLIHVVDST